MSGFGGALSLPLPLGGLQRSLLAALNGTRPVVATVVAASEGLVLEIAGAKVAVPNAPPDLQAGQRVTAVLVQTDKGPVLRITPQIPAPSNPTASPATTISSDALSAVLKSLSALTPRTLSIAPALTPSTPMPEAALRALLGVFVARRDAGRALVAISRALAEAVQAGALSGEAAREVEAFAARMKATDAAAFREALHAARAQTGKPVEALLARMALTGADTVLRESLVAQLAHLQREDGFVSFLRGNGSLARFEAAVETLLEHFRGIEIQQVRSLDQAYTFLELPLHPESEIVRAQIHIFGDDESGRDNSSDESSTVVLDLSLTRLGDLWITLRCIAEVCVCRIEAVEEDVVKEIAAQAELLERALGDAGYANVTVQTGVWSGDRLEAVAQVLQSAAALDISA